jgi:hypothetical protein
MADEKELAILKQGVVVWNTWRRENPGSRPELGEAKLGEADLRGAYLHEVNLSGAKLTGANLSGADGGLRPAGDHGRAALAILRRVGGSLIGPNAGARRSGRSVERGRAGRDLGGMRRDRSESRTARGCWSRPPPPVASGPFPSQSIAGASSAGATHLATQ